jgi:hypothetical protein
MDATLFVSLLVQQAPLFLVYLGAVLLALTFWRRCPVPCALTLGGVVLLFLVSIGQMLLNNLLFARDGSGLSSGDRMTVLTVVNIAAGILRALGFGLVVAAVFHGRNRPQEPSLEQDA